MATQRRLWIGLLVVVAIVGIAVALASRGTDEANATPTPTTAEPVTTTTRERIGSTTTTTEPTELGPIPDPSEPLDGVESAPALTGGLTLAGWTVFDVDELLEGLEVAPASTSSDYDRDLFTTDSCELRAAVLVAESTRPARREGCTVIGGAWLSIYDGQRTDDPDELEVDHLVALHEAWVSGADRWSPERREAFAHDLGHPGALVAVTTTTNRSKGDRDPATWQPPNRSAWCLFASDWVTVKQRWGLSVDAAELRALRTMLAGCGIAPTTTTSTTIPAPPPVPTTIAPVPLAPAPACDPAYPDVCIPPAPPDLDCGDISFGMFRVLPPDPHGFDGNDDDGWGCESN